MPAFLQRSLLLAVLLVCPVSVLASEAGAKPEAPERLLFIQIEGLSKDPSLRAQASKALMSEAARLVDTQLSIIGAGGLKALKSGLERPNSFLLKVHYTLEGKNFDIEAVLYDEWKKKILSRALKRKTLLEELLKTTATAARVCFAALGEAETDK